MDKIVEQQVEVCSQLQSQVLEQVSNPEKLVEAWQKSFNYAFGFQIQTMKSFFRY